MVRGTTGPLPARIGPYAIAEKIGSGGMATVYRAYHPDDGREVALKVLASRFVEHEAVRVRFEREARALLQLSHPHILPVYDYGADAGTPYLVMQLLSGQSLDDLIRNGPLPVGQLGRLTRQIASALDYAHARGIIHRDIKPKNILLDGNGTPFLADFGVAFFAETEEAARVTLRGAFLGTAAYASPEQCRGEPLDRPSDIYSFGVMVFEMATGRLPFEAPSPLALLKLQLYEDPPNPRAFNPQLPQELYFVLLKALAKLPDGRYPSAMKFSLALDEALKLHPPPSHAVSGDDWLVGNIGAVDPDRPVSGPVSGMGPPSTPQDTPATDDNVILLPAPPEGEAADDGAGTADEPFDDTFDDAFDDQDDAPFDDLFDNSFSDAAVPDAPAPDVETGQDEDIDGFPEFEDGDFADAADVGSNFSDDFEDWLKTAAAQNPTIGDFPPDDVVLNHDAQPDAPDPSIRPLHAAHDGPRLRPLTPLTPPEKTRRWTWTRLAVYASMAVSLLTISMGMLLVYGALFSPGLALDATYRGPALPTVFDYPRAWSLTEGDLAVLSASSAPALFLSNRPVTPGGPYDAARLVIAVQSIDPVEVFRVPIRVPRSHRRRATVHL